MLFVCLISLMVVGVYGGLGRKDYYQEKPTLFDLPCLSAGGICMPSYDCPPGKLAKMKGMCPTEQKRGFECCYGLPLSEKICRNRGGECRSKTEPCPDPYIDDLATDCDEKETCCILVK